MPAVSLSGGGAHSGPVSALRATVRGHLVTFDERHFRSVRLLDDDAGAFTLLPADAG